MKLCSHSHKHLCSYVIDIIMTKQYFRFAVYKHINYKLAYSDNEFFYYVRNKFLHYVCLGYAGSA